MLLCNRGIRSRVQITSFALSVCLVRRVVEIVDSYPCDHCYVCLIISLINFIPFGLLRNRFINPFTTRAAKSGQPEMANYS